MAIESVINAVRIPGFSGLAGFFNNLFKRFIKTEDVFPQLLVIQFLHLILFQNLKLKSIQK